MIRQGNQSNKREDFDTLKRPRSSSEKRSPRKTENYQQGKSVKTDNEIPAESTQPTTLPERKSRKQLEEEAWVPQSKTQRAPESRSRKQKREGDDICPKCHHRKGRIRSKSSDQHLKSVKGKLFSLAVLRISNSFVFS